jgi:hypothetical protein
MSVVFDAVEVSRHYTSKPPVNRQQATNLGFIIHNSVFLFRNRHDRHGLRTEAQQR